MTDSYVKIAKSGAGAAFIGPDATALFTAVVLRLALRSYARTKLQMNRGYTPSRMLAKTTEFTGQKYKRGEYLRAAADLDEWINAMKAALPIEVDVS